MKLSRGFYNLYRNDEADCEKGQVLHVHHGDIVIRYNFGKFVTFAFLHLCYVDLIGLVTDYL
jgi:hypothetical protein